MSEMKIGQLAKASGVKTDTVRYYETLKLIEPAGRTRSGYRVYDEAAVDRIAFIRRSKSLGFKLSEITSLLELQTSQTASCEDMLLRTKAKIKEAEENIQYLKRMRNALESLAADCPGGAQPLTECPILDYLAASTIEMNNK
jgi:DNA-binding transcriptional MerR regulator